MWRRLVRAAAAAWIIGATAAASAEWPWISSVASYEPGIGQWKGVYRDPSRLLGPPKGAGPAVADNSSVVTLGDGGTVTVAFDPPLLDDPRNPNALDFIVFSNAIWSGGSPNLRWQEPAFVEVSEDGQSWYLILPNKLPGALVGSPAANRDTGASTTVLRGYAEYTPTLPLPEGTPPELFYTIPDRPSEVGDTASLLIDAGSGGGDAMDIAWAVRQSSPGLPAAGPDGAVIPAQLAQVRYVRLTDALVGDTQGALGEVSAEIDAVAAALPSPEPPGLATSRPPGIVVHLDQVIVTLVTSEGVFVQAGDRSGGVLLRGDVSCAPGDRIEVAGVVAADGAFGVRASRLIDSPGLPSALIADRGAIGPGGRAAGLLVTALGRAEATSGGGWALRLADGDLQTIVGGGSFQAGALVKVTGVSWRGSFHVFSMEVISER